MSWCSDAPEDEAISLFAGLLANPDMRLSPCNRSVDDKLVYPHPIPVSVGIFSSVQQKFFVFPLFTTGDVTRRTAFEGTNSGQSVFL